MDVQTIMGLLFGAGGVGALTVLVTSYRRLKTGKLTDDDSIIERMHKELKRQESRANSAEAEAEAEVRLRNWWREQAIRYRLQLIAAGIEPEEMEPLK